ncbi:amino acid ABC transporter substrate-binding protein [Pseudaminobacter sp. 19-2017]|uniref:Amino acid ABC transporter substrate-binding protein n=1 Tax=Pseudaminobacter soli (ex Zhang et al. 2022) TaxID=2831468 RepID=A0A942E426_9HYPH|nr:ABC transporter substrate-binding protein [Pseudaminobacter soli]MBS3650591.1 amino acid ABC transporter substrate-binding protein [Pseudaminobacter soli]
MKFSNKVAGLAAGSMMALAATAASAAEGYGECKLYGKQGTEQITPAVPGQFTAIINLPAVGEFNGDTPETVTSGREFCMAVNIAYRLGLDKVVLKNASFDSIVAGQNKDFDIALALISVTEPRKKVVDFSTPYSFGSYGLAAKAGSNVTEDNVRDAKFGTQAGTTMVSWAQDTLKVNNLSVFDDTGAMFTAVAAGNVDVVMTELSIVLGQVAASNGKLEVVGQYEIGGETAGIYPKGSSSKSVIDKIIADMQEDGTLKDLEAQYLAPAWGGKTPADVPTWKF